MPSTKIPQSDSQAADLKQLNALLREKVEKLQQTEAALRESEERYALAMAGSRDGLWDWNVVTNEVYYSPRFKAILGYEEDEIAYEFSEFKSRLHPDDRERILSAVQNHLSQKVPYDVEYRLRTKQGDYRWIHAQGQAIWDDAQQPIRMAGSISDITERRQATARIQEVTQRLALATDSAGIGVWDYYPIENRLIWDEQMYALYGITASTFGGAYEAWQQGVHPEDLPAAHTNLQAALAGERDFHPEFRVVWPDGQVRYIEAHAIVLRDDSGKAQRMIGVNWDITARKQAQDDLRQLNEDLEAQVKARTREVELRAKELERSNAELQQFAYVASHDLQEPLRTVSSFTELLVQEYGDRLDGEAEEYVEFIVDGSLRMQQLIKDLLAYSRVDSRGKAFAQTDCEQVLKRVLVNLKFAIADGQANITHDPLPEIFADESQVQQLFQNLISNALKFRGEKLPHVHISASLQPAQPAEQIDNQACTHNQASSEQLSWRFCVSDNGIGIEPDYREKIFEIFQRLHSRRIYAGTGIGLAICRKIVQRHGGHIWVEESADKGAAFCFTLPS
ncbi:PAS fold family [Synechococcus sp. PCC 7335]|uniref:sensor histidine kinase n=1 Tax=Synechococcus sp. (strain ATCC 29403 / PCC 7335) TaxID=91464 RepID=UPI00017EDD5F|nr:PAS domain-containing protein [Synechococcus sp. PCC 7335]EDX82904.1 PAS fold family [Synechococcus sp. PCC 7335]